MELDSEIFKKFSTIDWFSNLGIHQKDEFQFDVCLLDNVENLRNVISSQLWQDARTESQGDLTGHLAKSRYDLFGGHWNKLAKASRQIIDSQLRETILKSSKEHGLEDLVDNILLDLNRISLFSAYSKKVASIPQFYGNILLIYEAGHLPCGWVGSMKKWPHGKIVIL